MKRIAAAAAAIILSIITTTGFAEDYIAEDYIKVIIDNEEVEFDALPCIINDTTLVPMRRIFEKLGAKVNWIPESQLIIASSGTNIIAMEIGSDSFNISDVVKEETKKIELDVPAQIISDRTFIPIRAVSEALNKSVEWDGQTRTITIK